MIDTTKNLSSVEIALNGGVDEISAVTKVPTSTMLQMENFRVSEDGQRIEKRDGLTELVTPATIGAKKVFGFHTYYNASAVFCQLIIAEDKVWRKVGAAAWTSIHTWASTLDHPVKVHEVQGKQIIVTEIENIMILAAGTVVPLGITSPATIPTLAASNDGSLTLDEDFASITDWVNADSGGGASTAASGYLQQVAAGAGQIAMITRAAIPLTTNYVISMNWYAATLGRYSDGNYAEYVFINNRVKLVIRIDSQDIYVYSGTYYVPAGKKLATANYYNFNFHVKTDEAGEESVEIFVDGVSVGQLSCQNYATADYYSASLAAYGTTNITMGWLKAWDSTNGQIAGTVRYAIAFARSGNYGGESNPIKSMVGAVSFSGTHLNDMTVTGTYAGDITRTIRVYVESVGATDIIKWSMDDGVTWDAQTMPMTSTAYLPWDITLHFAATTGHTATEYWYFTCYAISVAACYQKITLTSIPVSADSQVNQRKIYRTLGDGADYYLCAILNDNVTTTFVDNMDDDTLAYGEAMRVDRDVAPLGKYSLWWDDRLWIADETENMLYYSQISEPEHFYIAYRYISIRSGTSKDVIKQIKDYPDFLYVLKERTIFFIRKKLSDAYGRYTCPGRFGAIAPWSVIEIYGLLMFVSHRGWEVFNGTSSYSIKFSQKVRATMRRIDKLKADYICAAHNEADTEVWLSIPDFTTGSAKTVVFNYSNNTFYHFSFPKVPSCLAEARDSLGAFQVYMGTRDGYVYLCESGLTDGGTNITAVARLPWIKFPTYFETRRLEIEYECPAAFNLSVDYYVNLEKTTRMTTALAGSTPTSADQSIRLPIDNFVELDLRGKFLSLKFSNAEAIGSDLKLNSFKLLYAPMERKNKILGD